ncbi:MAG: prolyl oligopeptidase family serine peptidase [Clostridia bacterium]|nr:prolyl oligopeptidase family serine peptidase [Clostridia bacterium]
MNTVDSMIRDVLNYKNTVTGDEMDLPYRVYYPSNMDETKKYPMMFFLHGHGECGTNNEYQIRVLQKPNELLDRIIERDNCIIVAPQCPCEHEKHEWINVHHVWTTGSREKLDDPSVAMQAAMMLLDMFLAKPFVDLDRVYAAGISMGGYGMWEIVTRRPDVFAAAVPVCGAGFPGYAEQLKDISVWIFHGLADGTVPPSGGKDMEAALKKVGADVRATYYEGVGHNSWIPAYKEPDLIDWLMSKSLKK